MTAERQEWLDALRGVTITLVVLNHCIQASSVLLETWGHDLPTAVEMANSVLRLVRMPAFFLCSGILFAVTSQRGWGWFIRRRLLWTAWIVVLWELGAMAVMSARITLYPLRRSTELSLWEWTLISPIGNMWFIYAIALASLFCMIVRPMGRTGMLAAAAAASVALVALALRLDLPEGIELTVMNLGTKGLLFFTLGFVFSAALMRPKRGNGVGFALALILWGGCWHLLRESGHDAYLGMVLALPATFAAIHALQVVLLRCRPAMTLFAALGTWSLELFLLHQFAIAGAMMVLRDLSRNGFAVPTLALMVLGTLTVSLAAARLLRTLPGNMAFSLPR